MSPTEPIEVTKWIPDYKHNCEVCGTNHVVTGITDEKIVYQGTMCGVCTWGESAMLDPVNWNE